MKSRKQMGVKLLKTWIVQIWVLTWERKHLLEEVLKEFGRGRVVTGWDLTWFSGCLLYPVSVLRLFLHVHELFPELAPRTLSQQLCFPSHCKVAGLLLHRLQPRMPWETRSPLASPRERGCVWLPRRSIDQPEIQQQPLKRGLWTEMLCEARLAPCSAKSLTVHSVISLCHWGLNSVTGSLRPLTRAN